MFKKILLIIVFLLIIFGLAFLMDDSSGLEVSNFQECLDAGYPVMESYPRQCSVPTGETFVEETEDEFYGSSTNFPCETDEECITSGCNSEICGGEQEEGFASICLFPEHPLPQDLGYVCGCFENECQWGRQD